MNLSFQEWAWKVAALSRPSLAETHQAWEAWKKGESPESFTGKSGVKEQAS